MSRQILGLVFKSSLLIMVIGLACNLGSGSQEATVVAPPTDVPPPTNPPPTEPPPPTSTPLPTSPPPTLPPPEPTDAPPPEVEESPAFYIEEFETVNPDYTYFVLSGVDGGTDMVYFDEGAMVFDIPTSDTWVYVTYDPWLYGDVRVGLSAENRGVNSQRVSLTCRISEDGWFEFNIGGDGLYEILVYDAAVDRFFNIANGGSVDIQLGRNTNVYIAECVGDNLTLSINGELTKSVPIPSDYRFMDEGSVGFAVSSFTAIPVRIDIDWFGIESP